MSLLHFCVIFLMAGVIILIVGAVQFKLEAELYHYRHCCMPVCDDPLNIYYFRHIIVTAGCATLGLGKERNHYEEKFISNNQEFSFQ